jgi:hypothetical protein
MIEREDVERAVQAWPAFRQAAIKGDDAFALKREGIELSDEGYNEMMNHARRLASESGVGEVFVMLAVFSGAAIALESKQLSEERQD